MDHQEWLSELCGGDTVNGVATRAGLVQSTLQRQLDRAAISAENVIAIALAYGAHPVGALVDTGYLDEKWATQIDPARALREVTEEQLADEVLRRMLRGFETTALTTPVDELAARRARYRWSMPEDAVADGSPEDYDGTEDDWSV